MHEFENLWDAVSGLQVPVMLVRGMRPQSVVDDADEAELIRRQPGARIEHVADAGHSVQGDTPVELARLIDSFAPTR
jgi:pimeloyl-ACP methyl ester carboxylesterase